MLIYRIEHKENPRRGPFRGEGYVEGDNCPAGAARLAAALVGSIDPFKHPVAGFLMWGENPHLVCGMPSLDAYRTWFAHPEVRAALYDGWDYHMRVYDVPDHLVEIEMLQVGFDPDDATSVRNATPEEMA